MDLQKKSKATALIVTVLCHIALLIFIIFSAFVTPLPLPGEEGVEVQLGSDYAGVDNDFFVEPTSVDEHVEQSEKLVDDETLTSNSEEDIFLEDEKDNEIKEEIEDVPTVNNPEPVVNPNALYKGSKSNNESSGNKGSTGDEGNSGSKYGTPNSDNLDGLGGSGSGTSFSLEGRSAVNILKPEYTSQEQGVIVVEIMVNKKGDVVSAVAGKKGTTITDQTLWNKAYAAAMQTKFSPNPKAAELQKGTITYNFRRVNE